MSSRIRPLDLMDRPRKKNYILKAKAVAVKLKRQIIGRLRGSQPLLSHKCFSRVLFIFLPTRAYKNCIHSSLSISLAEGVLTGRNTRLCGYVILTLSAFITKSVIVYTSCLYGARDESFKGRNCNSLCSVISIYGGWYKRPFCLIGPCLIPHSFRHA